MTTFIIAAITADGFIGKSDDHAAFWTSKEDKKRFVELTKRAGVTVIGKKTWKTIGKPLKGRVNIVYTRGSLDTSPEILKDLPENTTLETTTKEPKELINELESRGFKEVAICGGSQIYSMFMEAGVVDKLYITVEPIIFGNGIKLFNDAIEAKLKLESERLVDGTLLLEYSVIK